MGLMKQGSSREIVTSQTGEKHWSQFALHFMTSLPRLKAKTPNFFKPITHTRMGKIQYSSGLFHTKRRALGKEQVGGTYLFMIYK